MLYQTKKLTTHIIVFVLLAVMSLIASCGGDDDEMMFPGSVSCEDFTEPVDLTGIWRANNWNCDGVIYSESVNVAHDLATEEVAAVKIDGDPCVEAGDTTFTATFDGISCRFNMRFRVGSPGNPSSGWGPGGLMILITEDEMYISHNNKQRFTRQD